MSKTERDRKIEIPPLKPYQILKRLKEPNHQPEPKFLGERMLQIDDIQGAKSRRLYRGKPRDVFRTEEIEGAYPHKARRSPRPFAFDDYKDVTTARKYRRPFLPMTQEIQSNYYNYKDELSRNESNSVKNKDRYSIMNYYELPLLMNKDSNKQQNSFDRGSETQFKPYESNLESKANMILENNKPFSCKSLIVVTRHFIRFIILT